MDPMEVLHALLFHVEPVATLNSEEEDWPYKVYSFREPGGKTFAVTARYQGSGKWDVESVEEV